jgi:hypothetical protein
MKVAAVREFKEPPSIDEVPVPRVGHGRRPRWAPAKMPPLGRGSSRDWRFAMKPLSRAAVWLFAVAVLAGCASTEVSERQRYEEGSGEAEMRAAVEGYQATATGLRLLGHGEVAAEGTEMPGVMVPLAVLAATANPIGLVVAGGAKLYGEGSGSDTIEGAAERTAGEVAAQLRKAAEEQDWI